MLLPHLGEILFWMSNLPNSSGFSNLVGAAATTFVTERCPVPFDLSIIPSPPWQIWNWRWIKHGVAEINVILTLTQQHFLSPGCGTISSYTKGALPHDRGIDVVSYTARIFSAKCHHIMMKADTLLPENFHIYSFKNLITESHWKEKLDRPNIVLLSPLIKKSRELPRCVYQ